MPVDNLVQFGLTNKQAKVYLSLLELGISFVVDVSQKANINRSTTYVVLEELVRKGLVSISEEKSKRQYKAESPERLIQLLEEQAKAATKAVNLARQLLPELKSIYPGVGIKPRVSFYEGSEGLMSVYEDTLTSSEPIRAYASIENMHQALPNYFPAYYQRRAAKGMSIRAIFPDTDEAEERMRWNSKEAREAYLVPKERFAFSPEINIYDNKIAFMSLREKFGLIIESPELAEAMKSVFELSWLEAKRQNESLRRKPKRVL